MMRKFLIYDCEIEKCILPKCEEPKPSLKYCEGWEDYEGMGISVIGAYTSWDNRFRVFCKDNLHWFQEVVKIADEIIGFNSIKFDDNLCKAHGINIKLLMMFWSNFGALTACRLHTYKA